MTHRFRALGAALAAFCLMSSSTVSALSTTSLPGAVIAPRLTVDAALEPLTTELAQPKEQLASLETREAPRPSAPASLHEAVQSVADAVVVGEELRCLATAVYFESKSEPLEGQLAVAQVIVNRSTSGRFPSSLCGVVRQPGQFSYGQRRVPTAGEQWRKAKAIASIAMSRGWSDVAQKALFFHAARVSPDWGKRRIARIGNHIFYR